MNLTPQEQIANAIGMSFAESMETKAPELQKIIKNKKLKSLEIIPVKIDGKNQMQCNAESKDGQKISFTFPLKPLFLQEIETKMGNVFKEVRQNRQENMEIEKTQ